MTYDPLKLDSTWTQVLPGCYVDPAGAAHFFPHEFLAFLVATHPEAGFDPNSEADYDRVVASFSEVIKEAFPDVEIKIVQHERRGA